MGSRRRRRLKKRTHYASVFTGDWGRSALQQAAPVYTGALLATMSLTLKQRGKSILHSGSCLSYNEGVIGLTEHCLSFHARPCKL